MANSKHQIFMKRCLELALKGLGTTYPNPLVGSVVVFDNQIIGEGWHYKSGLAHAEVNAINQVKQTELLQKSILYVNLEPCSHFGKTPPCAHLIVEKGIKKVVIGTLDYNNEVYGKGVEYLKAHGCEVVVGVLEEQCLELNKRFFTFHQKKRPYIILKWAESKDGFIFPKKAQAEKGQPYWISNKRSRQLVHQWRTEEQAIMVGTNTVIQDNPKLNARDFEGNSPIRIVLDRALRITKDANIYDHSVQTIVYNQEKSIALTENTSLVQVKFDEMLLPTILSDLFKMNIQSIIVEGGFRTLQSFIDQQLWDEARVFVGENNFEGGIRAPQINGKTLDKVNIMNDSLTFLQND